MRFAHMAAVAAFGLLLIAGPALAENEPRMAKVGAPTTTAGDTHAGEKKEGGLSFLALERYDLGIFTLIVFGLLCFILMWFAWPKISEGLAKREAAIAGARDEAIQARKDAEDIREKLKVEFALAQDKIRAMMDEARRDADALRVKEKETGVAEATAERKRALADIETAKQHALAEIQQQAIQLASLMSTKAVRRSITADDHSRLLAESLDELRKTVTKA